MHIAIFFSMSRLLRYWVDIQFSGRVLRAIVLLLCVAIYPFYSNGQDPQSIANLEFWLRSDAQIILTDEKISSWGSLNNSVEAENATVSRRPTLVPDVFTSQSGVFFGGGQTGRFLNVDPGLMEGSFTFYTLVKTAGFENPVQYIAGITPDIRAIGVLNSSQQLVFFDDGIQLQTAQSLLPESFYLLKVSYDAANSEMTMDLNFGEIIAQAIVPEIAVIENFKIGTRSDQNWSFSGSMAEMLFFSRVLDAEEQQQMNNYFQNYYAPPHGLPEEIQLASFCDTVLTIPDRYTEIFWSTGSTDDEAVITQPGEVSVSAVTIFGDTIESVVQVNYPGEELQDFSLCLGSDTIWNPEIPDFDISWQDGSTDPNFTIQTAGQYFYQAIDGEGCVYNSDTLAVDVDSFSATSVLPETVALCAGSMLATSLSNPAEYDFLWSSDEITPQIEITDPGDYWLQVTNQNGCIAEDTVTVSIEGVAPMVGYSLDSFCAETELTFQDESLPGDGSDEISEVEWFLNDQILLGNTVAVTFAEPGNYPLQITATTEAGCFASLFDTITIQPVAQVNFNYALACSGQSVLLEDSSFIATGNLSLWLWDFGNGSTSIAENTSVVFDEPGVYDVSLTVTSTEGCSAVSEEQVAVYPSPDAVFIWSKTCEGMLMNFESETNSDLTGPLNYAWNFAGVIGSGETEQHLFPESGLYNVSHEVWSSIDGQPGCFDTQNQTVVVNVPPEVSIGQTIACAGQPFTLTDLTEPDIDDEVVTRQWTLEGIPLDTTEVIAHVIDNTGTYVVMLTVETEAGCMGQASDFLEVGSTEPTAFEISPEIGAPPLDVQFSNTGAYGVSHTWNFGDEITNQLFEPIHTYADSGIFYPTLTVTDEAGCVSVGEGIVYAIEPYFDVSVEAVDLVMDDDQIIVSCVIGNFNNHRLLSAELSMWLGNGTVVTELWQGELGNNQLTTFQFQSRLNRSSEINQAYLCVQIDVPNGVDMDAVLENNRLCKSISSLSFQMFSPYPNPAVSGFDIGFHLRQQGRVNWRLVQSDGKTVVEQNGDFEKGFNSLRIDTQSLRSGIYTLWMSHGEDSSFKRILIENRSKQ